MPRPKVSEEHRRRCAQACDNCKRRKEKCDGLIPCNLCRRRGREPECHYTEGPVRTTRTTHLQKKSIELRDDTGNSSDTEMAIESAARSQNQRLHDNADGTFSIVNPETSAPYPGTMGMEKEKPYKWEVCGGRYKTSNGLKYHKQRSPLHEVS